MFVGMLLFSCFISTASAKDMDPSDDPSLIFLRAGGGGSNGGSSGGSSGDSGGATHHSGGRYRTSQLQSILEFIMLPIILFSSSLLFYVKLSKRSRKSKKLMKQMMKKDRAWKFKDISSIVNQSFFAIQTAWTNMDMSPAKKYMSDELYQNFQTKLNWMAYRNQKNILENIQLVKALPVAVYDDIDNSRDYVWFYVKGNMVDYIINTDTRSIISGNTSATTFVEYWQFVRKDSQWVLNRILQKNETNQISFSE